MRCLEHRRGRGSYPGCHSVYSSEVKIVQKASILHIPPRHLPNSPHHCHTQDGHHRIENGCEGGREGERKRREEGRAREKSGERKRREGGGIMKLQKDRMRRRRWIEGGRKLGEGTHVKLTQVNHISGHHIAMLHCTVAIH